MNAAAIAILDHFDDSLPLSRASTLPSDCYSSASFAEAEAASIFSRSWQYVGSLQQLPNRGSYLRSQIGSEAIFAIRGEDDRVRVFLNVCRHRAAPIITDDCGNCTKLRCRYHGWTYDLQGQLRGVPEFDGVEDFAREDNSLIELQSADWGDFLFARIESGPDDLKEHLAPMPDKLRDRLKDFRFYRRVVFSVESNWKIAIDNYLDGGYHVHTVHPALAGSLDYKNYRTETFIATSLQSSPLTKNEEDSAANRTRQGETASYWWAYPNFMLNLYEGVMDLNYVIPRSPDSCDVVIDFFFTADDSPESIAFKEESIRVACQVQEEDNAICRDVQRNIRSQAYFQGRFSVKRENGGYHFHQLLARQIKKSLSVSAGKESA